MFSTLFYIVHLNYIVYLCCSYPSHGGYNQDFYNPEMDPYYQSYDSSQDMQWGGQMMNQVMFITIFLLFFRQPRI